MATLAVIVSTQHWRVVETAIDITTMPLTIMDSSLHYVRSRSRRSRPQTIKLIEPKCFGVGWPRVHQARSNWPPALDCMFIIIWISHRPSTGTPWQTPVQFGRDALCHNAAYDNGQFTLLRSFTFTPFTTVIGQSKEPKSLNTDVSWKPIGLKFWIGHSRAS